MRRLHVVFGYALLTSGEREHVMISLVSSSSSFEATPALRQLLLELRESGWLERYRDRHVHVRVSPLMRTFGLEAVGYERFTLPGKAVEQLLRKLEEREPSEAAAVQKFLSQRRRKVEMPVKTYTFDDLLRLGE